MVSSRAQEYITRFSKGVQKKTALKKITEYREECKKMYYNGDDTSNDMVDRINSLLEAREFLQEQIDNNTNDKNARMYSAYRTDAKPLVAKKPVAKKNAKPTNLYEIMELAYGSQRPYSQRKGPYDIESLDIREDSRSYFKRTAKDLRGYDENVIKYILRYQHLGLPSSPMNTANACDVLDAIEKYRDGWDCFTDDEKYNERAEIAIIALDEARSYFEDIDELIIGAIGEADADNQYYELIEKYK